jgi:hypothetical protein
MIKIVLFGKFQVGIDICAALKALHSLGIIHRLGSLHCDCIRVLMECSITGTLSLQTLSKQLLVKVCLVQPSMLNRI